MLNQNKAKCWKLSNSTDYLLLLMLGFHEIKKMFTEKLWDIKKTEIVKTKFKNVLKKEKLKQNKAKC